MFNLIQYIITKSIFVIKYYCLLNILCSRYTILHFFIEEDNIQRRKIRELIGIREKEPSIDRQIDVQFTTKIHYYKKHLFC